MKLRNKKTGEVVEAESCNSYSGTIGLFFEKGRETDRAYESLAELNKEWEDYTPRIEDDKVRKLVKQWLMISRVNNENIFFDELMNGFYLYEENSDRSAASISFPDNIKFNLEDSKDYTFAELCGEEE